ncbi:MAG: TetR/AcrR family transcriptional regulator [Lachnospiraceae bacterium]
MENQRIRISKTMLKNALIDLLQEKPIETITIYELCRRATINRTTFYKYYGSQYDLLEDIEKDVFKELEERLAIACKKGEMGFSSALEYIIQEQKKCLVLMNSTADKDFAKKLFELPIINNLFQININIPFEKEMELYVTSFLYNGGYSVIREWANRGFQESPEQIEQLIIKLITSGSLSVLSRE